MSNTFDKKNYNKTKLYTISMYSNIKDKHYYKPAILFLELLE